MLQCREYARVCVDQIPNTSSAARQPIDPARNKISVPAITPIDANVSGNTSVASPKIRSWLARATARSDGRVPAATIMFDAPDTMPNAAP